MATTFDPFWLFKAPFSGDVRPRIHAPWFSPAFNFNFAGDVAVEDRVVSEVASYGTQIGWLNDIVLDLVNQQTPDGGAVAKLAAAVEKIEKIKSTQQSDAMRTAADALDQLKKNAPDLYGKLIAEHGGGSGSNNGN